MKKKKVVFFAGKRIGYECIRYTISQENIEIPLIISNTSDLYQGDNRWYPCVADLAKSAKIPYISSDKPNTTSMINKIRKINPDLIFLIYYDNIIIPEIYELSKKGTVNLHMADSEKYRGAYPTVFAIISDEKEYGVTLHYVDGGIDSGPLIAKKTFPLEDDWTGKDLYDFSTKMAFNLFKKNLNNILEDKISARPQKSLTKTYSRSEFPSHEIKFNKGGKEIFNNIRSLIFDPFPKPFFFIGKRKFLIIEDKALTESKIIEKELGEEK